MDEKEFNGRILIRISPELHKNTIECSTNLDISLNEFITESIKERVEKIMIINSSFERVVIGDQKVKDLREAVIVTQNPWFMEIFNKYKIYFFNPEIGRITAMQYLLCYETIKVEPDGSENQNKRHIGRWGKVREILFGININNFSSVPELLSLSQDEKFWERISQWEDCNVVILEEVGDINNPIPLKDSQQARILINKTTTLTSLRNAESVEDLFR